MNTGMARSVFLIQSHCTSKCLITAAKYRVFSLFKQNLALFSSMGTKPNIPPVCLPDKL